jgi:ABC-type Na+ efflux pump permease subunit
MGRFFSVRPVLSGVNSCMRKAWIVAKHEFSTTVKRVWFIVATFGFPLLFLAIGGTITLLAKRTIETKQAEMQA